MKHFASILIFFCIVYITSKISAQTNDFSFSFIKGGNFKMGNNTGDDDEEPIRKIYLSDFYISKYEVTNKEFCTFLNSLKPDASLLRKYINLSGTYKRLKCRIYLKDSIYYTETGFEDYPVNFVSWFGADAYCKYIGGRLPSETEWEYAAKGGKQTFFSGIFRKYIYAGSNKPDEVAWYRKNSENKPHKTGQKKPNKATLFDMSGNVSEWCSDWYSPEYYKSAPEKNPQGPETGQMKVHRGGSWYNTPEMLRITNRRASKPVTENATIGFRVVKDNL